MDSDRRGGVPLRVVGNEDSDMSRFVAPPPAPNTLHHDPRTPYNCDVRLRNLVHNMRVLHIVPWMQDVTFSEVVEMWWYAQSVKQDKP